MTLNIDCNKYRANSRARFNPSTGFKRATGSVLMLLSLFACVSVDAKKGVPDWYINPPLPNDTHLCGVGEFPSPAAAKCAALSDIASYLSTTLSAEPTINSTYQSDQDGAIAAGSPFLSASTFSVFVLSRICKWI